MPDGEPGAPRSLTDIIADLRARRISREQAAQEVVAWAASRGRTMTAERAAALLQEQVPEAISPVETPEAPTVSPAADRPGGGGAGGGLAGLGRGILAGLGFGGAPLSPPFRRSAGLQEAPVSPQREVADVSTPLPSRPEGAEQVLPQLPPEAPVAVPGPALFSPDIEVLREELFGPRDVRQAQFRRFLSPEFRAVQGDLPISGPLQLYYQSQFPTFEQLHALQLLTQPGTPLSFEAFLAQPDLLTTGFAPSTGRALLGTAAKLLASPQEELTAEQLAGATALGLFGTEDRPELATGNQAALAASILARGIPPEFRRGYLLAAQRAFDEFLLNQGLAPGDETPHFLPYLAARGFRY